MYHNVIGLIQPATVTAQFRENPDDARFPFNLIVIAFREDVVARENR